MINTKYKINLLTKDLELKPKEMTQYLTDSGISGKTSQATIEGEEFSALLNTITKANQITDMGAYLNGTTKIRVKKTQNEAKAPAAKDGNKEKPTQNKQNAAKNPTKQENNKPANTQNAEKKAVKPVEATNVEPEKKKVTPPPPPQNKSKQELQEEKQNRFRTAAQNQQNKQNQPAKDQKKNNKVQPAKERPVNTLLQNPAPAADVTVAERTSGEHVTKTRVVDTRSAGNNVDLSRYDERLETFVDTDRKKFQGNDNNKQKLKKQNNGKGGKTSVSEKERQAMERLRKQEM